MTTLAIDIGQGMGWVKGSAVGPLEYGTFAMPDTTDLGKWLAGADTFLAQAMRGVDDIAVEQPFLGDSYYPARKALAMLGHIYYHASFHGIAGQHVNEIPVSTGKLTLAGYGKADKDQMIAAACAWYGWEPEDIDEHIADAGGIMKVHLFGAALGPRKKPRTGKGTSILRGAPR